MGLLTEGSPLSWEETKKLSKHVREHGIEQFINLYRRLKDRTGDILKWGDEVGCNQFILFVCSSAIVRIICFYPHAMKYSNRSSAHTNVRLYTIIGILLMGNFDLNGHI